MGKRAYDDGTMVTKKRGKASQRNFTRLGRNRTTDKGRSWPYQRFYDSLYFDPFPYKMQVVMRYTESVIIPDVTVAGVVSHYLFRANGIYDPNFTGIGHQPMGHDQWSNIYNHYQVIESTCTIKPAICDDRIYGINLVANNTEPSWTANLESKGCKYVHSYTDSGQPPTVVNKYKASIYDNKFQQAALFGASPADPFFFDCFQQGRDSTSTNTQFAAHVTITYKVKMWEPKLLGGS